MKKIKDLVHLIKGEFKDADKYYVKALLAENDNEKRTYINLAKAEMEHGMKLHELVIDIISEYEGTPPPEMLAIWNYEHQEIVLDIDCLKNKINNL